MQKIGLLSLDSHNFNYGGMLQEYALQFAIEAQGNYCEVIDYRHNTELRTFSPRRNIRYLTWEKVYGKLAQLRQNRGKKKQIEDLIIRRKVKFNEFCNTYIKFSKVCKHDELKEVVQGYDSVVCGSDQIWNPAFNRPSFFLDFVPDTIGKVIYAASIARDTLTKSESKVYQEYIKPLEWISVRESGAVELLRQIAGEKEIRLVLDPSLLLTPVHWKNVAGEGRLINDKYLFCYFLGIDEEKRKAAQRFASGNGMRLISLPYLLGKYNVWDEGFSEAVIDAGPVEFLNLILHAECVLTDSFHASVFSILFQKRFRVFGRKFGKGDMNTRLHTLLSYIGHNEYLIHPEQLEECTINDKTDWSLNRIEECRKESLEWLTRALTKG